MTPSAFVEQRRRFVSGTILTTALLAVQAATPAFSQIAPPPRQDTRSATGVSYRSGAFSYEETDLSIGSDADRMVFARTYDSSTNMPSDIFTQGWPHSMLGFVSAHQLPQNADPSEQLPPEKAPYVYDVSIGGKSDGFIGAVITPPPLQLVAP